MSRKKAAGITRTEILDIAWELIAQNGADVSVQEIANAANVSRQSVYLHFKTRGGLLMALVKRADDRFTIKEDFLTAITIVSPINRLDECLRIWFDFVVKIQPVACDLIRLRKTDKDAANAWADRMHDLRSWEYQLVKSLAADTALAQMWTVDDATDYLWSASSVQIWDILTNDQKWDVDKTSKILRMSIAKALLI